MCVRIPKDSILECNLPCILHWNQNHFVVLYKIESKQKKYYICNPSKGLSMVNDDEFTVSWLSKSGVGIALLLEPTEKFGLQKEVMTTNRHSLSFILKYLLFVVNKTHFVTDIDFLHLVGIILIHLIAVNNDRARHLV